LQTKFDEEERAVNYDYCEELVRTEVEELALCEFGMDYCQLIPSHRWRLRELAIERLGAYESVAARAARNAA
jgi:hypothetical protein